MRAREFVTENLNADQVLQYVKRVHAPDEFNIEYSITDHPEWELKTIPLSQLNLDPDGEAQDPYNRVNWVDDDKVQELIPRIGSVLKSSPIVVDPQGWIIDGNHRAMAAVEAGLTSVPALVPVKDIAENMSHDKDGRAVEELKSALLAKRDQLQSATDDQVYDIIDRIMTRIARSHSISGQKLHDMWVDRYKQIPDTWIMNENVPQPGPSSGAPKKFGPDAKIQTRPMTAKQIISSIPGVTYYNNVVDDWDAKDYSWGVTKKVIEYATYLKQHPETLSQLPPVIVLNGKFEDGAHRVSALWLLQQRMDPKNPLWANAKLNVQFVEQGVVENFADKKVKGRSRPGRVKRAGASCAGSVTDLRAKARKYGGERGRMYHWCANMKGGKKK